MTLSGGMGCGAAREGGRGRQRAGRETLRPQETRKELRITPWRAFPMTPAHSDLRQTASPGIADKTCSLHFRNRHSPTADHHCHSSISSCSFRYPLGMCGRQTAKETFRSIDISGRTSLCSLPPGRPVAVQNGYTAVLSRAAREAEPKGHDHSSSAGVFFCGHRTPLSRPSGRGWLFG